MKVEHISRLYSIFSNNNWHILSDESNFSHNIFDNFCHTLENMNESQLELILDITDHFLVVTMAQYETLLLEAISLIDDAIVQEATRIHFVALKSPSDLRKHKTKSSDFVQYFARARVPIDDQRFDAAIISDASIVDGLPPKLHPQGNNLVILLDDFIGTGDTFDEFYEDFKTKVNISTNDNVIAVFLVGQQSGIERVENLGIRVFCARRRTRGITDNSQIANVPAALSKMENM